jgi:hypothetical protein
MLSLEMLGYYTDEPESQGFPETLGFARLARCVQGLVRVASESGGERCDLLHS